MPAHAHTPDTASLELARPAGGPSRHLRRRRNGGGVRRAGPFSGVSRASGAFGASARSGCPCKGGSIRPRSPARRQGHPPSVPEEPASGRACPFSSYRPSIRLDSTKSKTESKTTRIRCPLGNRLKIRTSVLQMVILPLPLFYFHFSRDSLPCSDTYPGAGGGGGCIAPNSIPSTALLLSRALPSTARRAPDDSGCRSLPKRRRPIRRQEKTTRIHIAGGSVLAVIWQCQAVLNPSHSESEQCMKSVTKVDRPIPCNYAVRSLGTIPFTVNSVSGLV
jgi:hypothetical protein